MPLFPLLPDEINEYVISFLRDHEHTLSQLAKTCRTGNTLVNELRDPLKKQAHAAIQAYILGNAQPTPSLIPILIDAFTHNRFYVFQEFLSYAEMYEEEFQASKDEVVMFAKTTYDEKLKSLAAAGDIELFKKYLALSVLQRGSNYAAFYAWPDLGKGVLLHRTFNDFEKILQLHPKPNPLLVECCAYYATLPDNLFRLDTALRLITKFRENYPKARFYGRGEIRKLLERIDQSSEACVRYRM